jgi:hypothetical protein
VARLKQQAARILALTGLLIAGVGASSALATPGKPAPAGPPTTVPGSPSDDCSHGNSGKDCKPDPSPNGKDCDDHGNARGNEDHCQQSSTTTTPTTPTTSSTTSTSTTSSTTSTTTPSTSTSSTIPTTSVVTTTSTIPSTSTTQTVSTPTTTPPSTTTGETAGALTPPTKSPTKQELQKELAAQVKGVQATRSSSAPANPNELPFTGFPAWLIALIGATMVASGLALRRATATAE